MATIGFREPSYTVVEGEGGVTVEVELRSGTIPPNNEVVVTFSTANQDAVGMCVASFMKDERIELHWMWW